MHLRTTRGWGPARIGPKLALPIFAVTAAAAVIRGEGLPQLHDFTTSRLHDFTTSRLRDFATSTWPITNACAARSTLRARCRRRPDAPVDLMDVKKLSVIRNGSG